MKPKRQAEQTEIEQRVTEVLELRLCGARYWDVLQYSTEKGWNLKERQLREYMSRADKLIEASLEKDREKHLARHLAWRQTIYSRAMLIGDYRTALAAAKEEAVLLGLYKPEIIKHEHAGPDGGPIKSEVKHEPIVPDTERMAAILSILADAGAIEAPAPAQPAKPKKK